jgi:hypothetical protein
MNEGVGVEHRFQRLPKDRGAHGIEPPGKPFADDDHIRLDREMLEPPEPSGAAQTGLDLVQNQEGADPVAHPADIGKVGVGGQGHAQGGRHRLQDNRGRVFIQGFCQSASIVERHLLETGRLGTERLTVFEVARGQGQPGMAVIPPLGGNDRGATGMGPGHLDGQIHGFTAARGKNSVIQIPRHEGRQSHGPAGPARLIR